jgi:2'-5' RNA ligase
MRLFLAINLPEDVKKELFSIGQRIEDFGRMKAVEEENIHLTLKFLGEAGPEETIDALEKVEFSQFGLSLKGLGAFPNLDYIKVLWAGVSEGFDEAVALNGAISETLPRFKEKKKYHPHTTLGRVKSVRDKVGMLEFIKENEDENFGSFGVESFELMKSELHIGGPQYEVLETFPLI